jgi:hypothetical protein
MGSRDADQPVTNDRPDRPGKGAPAFRSRSAGQLIAVLAGLRSPAVAILLAVAFFTTISGKPVDGVLMLIVALSLSWDTGRQRSRGSTPGVARAGVLRPPWGGRMFTALLVGGSAAYAGVVGAVSRYSWPATVGIVALGTLVVAIGWRGPLRSRPVATQLPAAGTAVWGGLFVAGCLWELAALLKQPTLTESSYAHPTISTLTDPVLASSTGRWVVLAGWLALGWYLVDR